MRLLKRQLFFVFFFFSHKEFLKIFHKPIPFIPSYLYKTSLYLVVTLLEVFILADYIIPFVDLWVVSNYSLHPILLGMFRKSNIFLQNNIQHFKQTLFTALFFNIKVYKFSKWIRDITIWDKGVHHKLLKSFR